MAALLRRRIGMAGGLCCIWDVDCCDELVMQLDMEVRVSCH